MTIAANRQIVSSSPQGTKSSVSHQHREFCNDDRVEVENGNRDSFQEQLDDNRILISSWLQKRSHKTHQWQKRWVVLRNCQLSYYKDSSEHKPSCVINRANLLSYSAIRDNNNKHHFAIYTSNRGIHWKTDDQNTYNQWINALELFIQQHDEGNENPPTESRIIPSKDYHFTKPNALAELDLSSSEDQYFSSGFDSPMSLRDHQEPTFAPSPILLEHPEEEETCPSPLTDKDSLDKPSTPPSLPRPMLESPASLPKSSPVPTPKTNIGGSDEYIIEQGYLLRLRKRYNQWRKFYIILTNENISFHKNNLDLSKPYKVIPIQDIVDVIELDPLSKTKNWCLLIITPEKRLRFCADSEEEMIKWLSALKTLVLKRRGSRTSVC